MATVLSNLQAALLNISAILVSVTANPKPDYSIGGKSIPWAGYVAMLLAQQQALNEAIAVAGGPVEAQTQGLS